VLSPFLGGFLQGMSGTGAGISMVAALIVAGYPLRVCIGSCGFLAFFVGASAIVRVVLHNELTLAEFGWFFGLCFVLGGTLTFLIYRKI